jgi:type III secretory pathway component EscU
MLMAAGFASGFMGTITSVGTPPMGLVMQNVEPGRLRATVGMFLVFGSIDLVRQLRRHKSELRMSKQDIKDEMKEMEGNPQMKARIRRLSIFQSKNDPEMRNRFQYRMILKSGTPVPSGFLSVGVAAEAGEGVQGEGAGV